MRNTFICTLPGHAAAGMTGAARVPVSCMSATDRSAAVRHLQRASGQVGAVLLQRSQVWGRARAGSTFRGRFSVWGRRDCQPGT